MCILRHVIAVNSMGKALTLILVVLALACEVVSAKTVPRSHRHRHARSHRRFQHLQDQVDRLDLRQKTDRILIENLQRALKEAEERDAWSSVVLSDFENVKDGIEHLEVSLQKAKKDGEEMGVWRSRAHDFDKKHHEVNSKKGAEERDARPSGVPPGSKRDEDGKASIEVKEQPQQSIEVTEQERRDEILLLRQEIAALRSEVKGLKEERAIESQQRSSHSQQQEHREAQTASWVAENIRRLQDAVVELQEAVNVTTALHDKQEVESRLEVVGRDLAALRSSLSAVTSKAEAAMATVETVREDLVRTAEDSNHARGKVELLGLEVSDIREEFNNLLSALPDGLTQRGLNASKKNPAASGSETPKHSSLTAGRGLEERVRATESDLGEVRASSIQLLDALEALEAQVEGGVAEVRQEVAKLEYKMTVFQDSANILEAPSSSNRSDIVALSNRISQLEVKISAIQNSANIQNVPNSNRSDIQDIAKNSGVPNIRSDIVALGNRISQLEVKMSAIQDGARDSRVPDTRPDTHTSRSDIQVPESDIHTPNSDIQTSTPDIQTLQNHVRQLEHKLRHLEDSTSASVSQVPNSHSDSAIKALTSRMDQMTQVLASVDSRSIADCHSKQLALDSKLNDMEERLDTLGRSVRR